MFAQKYAKTKGRTRGKVTVVADYSNTLTATFHFALDKKAKTMKQKKNQEEKEEPDTKTEIVDGYVPLCMRRYCEEYKDGSSREEIEDGSKKTAEAKRHAVAKIWAAAKQ